MQLPPTPFPYPLAAGAGARVAAGESPALPKRHLPAIDFDQALGFNDPGVVPSELPGRPGLKGKVDGPARNQAEATGTVGGNVLAMKARILFWSITSALAGFLFGFDTVVISGAEQKDPGALGPEPGDCTGSPWPRRCTARCWARCSAAGRPIASAQADAALHRRLSTSSRRSAAALRRDRLLLHRRAVHRRLGIGISTVAAPLYISEIAPPAYRGRLAGMFQFNIVFGILIAFALQLPARGRRRECLALDARRRGVSVAASTPSCASVIPESPRWLLEPQGRPRGGAASPAAHRARGLADQSSRPRPTRSWPPPPSKVDAGHFWTLAAARADPAGLPDRLLQPALRHQRDPLLRAAHF